MATIWTRIGSGDSHLRTIFVHADGWLLDECSASEFIRRSRKLDKAFPNLKTELRVSFTFSFFILGAREDCHTIGPLRIEIREPDPSCLISVLKELSEKVKSEDHQDEYMGSVANAERQIRESAALLEKWQHSRLEQALVQSASLLLSHDRVITCSTVMASSRTDLTFESFSSLIQSPFFNNNQTPPKKQHHGRLTTPKTSGGTLQHNL